MKNYYEILEVNPKSSQEIIEKVYKVFVKKYHPDLQTDPAEKAKCEEKIKEINEAYEVLSNAEKRAEYDNMLRQEYERTSMRNATNQARERNQQYQAAQHAQNQQYNQAPNQGQNPYQSQQQAEYQARQQAEQQAQEYARQQAEYQRQYQNAVNKAYHDAYIRDLKNRGYKIRYKKSFNDYVRNLISIMITIGIIVIVCQLPFVQNYFKSLYASNSIIRGIVDTFANLFK